MKGVLCGLLMLCVLQGYGQNFEEMRKRFVEQGKSMQESYEQFSNSAKNEYAKFREQVNAEYAEFVRNSWKEYQRFGVIEEPEDDDWTIPDKIEQDTNIQGEDIDAVIDDIIAPDPFKPQPTPVIPVIPIEESSPDSSNVHKFTIYGTDMQVRANRNDLYRLSAVSDAGISEGWRHYSRQEFSNLLYDCLQLREKYTLGDWAYLKMLDALSQSLFAEKNSNSVLLMAYLYCQSGYAIRMARSGNELVMLFASEQMIYNTSYYSLCGKDFYLYEADASSLMIADVPFRGEKPTSLLMSELPHWTLRCDKGKSLTMSEGSSLDVPINNNILAFYNEYPNSRIGGSDVGRWAMYAQTPMDMITRDSLYSQLSAQVAGKDILQAANYLLNFVQTSFEYGFDDKVWGADRAFFAEETLHYPFSDCEDRSILFSHLMRDLLGLEVALVYSPNHLFTAVHFPMEINGDYMMIGGKRFTICEPTCTSGAPVGYSAVKQNGTNVKVVVLKKNVYPNDYSLKF